MSTDRPLTDNEGALLSLVLRQQPITGYQIAKAFEASPVHTFNTSPGKLYPSLHRLVERGLLTSHEVPGDHRGTHLFSCSENGRQALREWALAIRPEHALLHDPLRKKLQVFELLSKAEQAEWVSTAKQRLARKLGEVDSWSIDAEGPFGDLVKDSAKCAIEARLAWLERAAERLRS